MTETNQPIRLLRALAISLLGVDPEQVKPLASQSKDQCLYQRHLITNLIPEVKQKTGINWEVIEKILSQKVNVPDDKFIAKPSEEFNKWNSISTFEVAGFVRRFWSSKRADEKAVGLALAQIYGIEEYFKTPPKPREITLLGAYDPDTITIIEKQSDDCDLPEVKYNMRISGVDAPEVDFKENFIPFLKAMVDQGNIFKIKGFNFTEEDPTIEENNDSISFMGEEAISPSLQKFYSDPWIRAILEKAAEYANDGQKIEMNFNGRKQKLPWTNPKLIQNIIKTFEAMGGAEGMSKQDQLNLLVLIGHYHTYGGQLGTIITNDYIHYIQDYKKLKFVSEESTTHFFTCNPKDNAPQSLVYVWEMGDRYMRRLGTPHLNDPLASRDYFRDILPKTMAKNKATRPDEILALKEYQDKFVKISKLLSAVRSSKDKHVLEIAAKFTDPGELDPRKLFSPEKAQLGIKIMHESLVKISKKYGDAYARQLMGNPMSYLVAYGLVLNYEKYRMENNYGFRYFAAAAKDAVMGLNIEATYNILPEYNEKKDGERYNPKDPKKGETC